MGYIPNTGTVIKHRIYRRNQPLPYHPFDHPIQTPKGFDGTFYPPGMETVPKKAAIVQANRYMVDTCGYLIAYVWRSGSNALELTDYARRKGKPHIAYLPRKVKH